MQSYNILNINCDRRHYNRKDADHVYTIKPTISLITTKRTTTSYLKSLNTKTDHEIWNGKCTDTKYGGVK